jgi:hypothetical protein
MGKLKTQKNLITLAQAWFRATARDSSPRLGAERRDLLETRRRILEKLSERLRRPGSLCS